jgi:hypothetical protein
MTHWFIAAAKATPATTAIAKTMMVASLFAVFYRLLSFWVFYG